MENWSCKKSHSTHSKNGDRAQNMSNSSTMKDNLTPRFDRWGPRLASPRRWGPRLGSTNGYKPNDNRDSDREDTTVRNPPTIARADEEGWNCASKLTGDHKCMDEGLNESLAQKMKSGEPDMLKCETSRKTSHSFTNPTADVLFSSDESGDPSFFACLDEKLKITSCNEIMKSIDEKSHANTADVLFSSDESGDPSLSIICLNEKAELLGCNEIMKPHNDELNAKKREHMVGAISRKIPCTFTDPTIDILSSSDGESRDPITICLDGKTKRSSCSGIIKSPNDDVCQDSVKYFSMSMSDSSMDTSQSQRVTRLGSATNQICLTSDDEHSSSALSSLVNANSRSFTNSSTYLNNKQRNSSTHYAKTMKEEPLPSTANDSTSSITVSPISVAISSPAHGAQISTNNSLLSGSISISQIKNGSHGSISPLSSNCKKKNSRLMDDIQSPSSKNRNMQTSNGMQSSSSSSVSAIPKVSNMKPSYTNQSSSSSSVSAVPQNRTALPSNETQSSSSSSISVSSIPQNGIIQPLNDIHSLSSSSLSAVPKNRNTQPSNEILSVSSSSLSALPKSRIMQPLNETLSLTSSSFSALSKSRNMQPLNETLSLSSSSLTALSKSRNLQPLNKMQSLSRPPAHTNTQRSNRIQCLSASSIPAHLEQGTQPSREIEILPTNDTQISSINRIPTPSNKMQNPVSSSVDLDSSTRYKYPITSNFTGNCVGTTVGCHVRDRDNENASFHEVDYKSDLSLAKASLASKCNHSSSPKSLDDNQEVHRNSEQYIMSKKEIHPNQITSADSKSFCLSEVLDESCYQILRNCEIYTLNDLRSCDVTKYPYDEQIVIDRAQHLTEGNKIKALMSIRGRRTSKNATKVLDGKLKQSDSISQLGNQGTDGFRNESFDSASIEFFKSEGIVTRENLLKVTVNDLTRKYDAWCTRYLHDQTKSSPLIVAKWQLIARSYESGYILEQSRKRRRKFSAISDQNNCYATSILQGEGSNKHRRISDADRLSLMGDVDRKTKIDPKDGRPVVLITAMNHETETLYDFRLYTGESHIPNSGFGAFLTFEGARLLKPEAAKRSKQLMKDRYPIDVPTSRFLEAKGIDGMNVSVSLKGDNLHGNGNNPYFRVTRFPLKATLQNGKRVQVTIGPERIHEDIDLLRKNNEIPSHTDGFGHFKITTKDDYTESEEDFCSHSDGCGLIDIGRYGPFIHSDRKTNLEFNLKDFVFDHEPAEWTFGVSEKLKGSEQVIDITSDSTGATHKVARDHLPMYVNEVGHNTNLCQNILSREEDDRVVNYYLYIQQPMRKGHTVELLTHYGDKYEETRERKGYGKANIECGLKDDFDDNTRMRHNISNRSSVEVTIKSMSLDEVEQTVHFLLNKIFIPLTIRIEWFTERYFELIGEKRHSFVEKHQLSTRQWRAWRRLSWLAAMFQNRVDVLMTGLGKHDSIRIINDGVCRMKWTTNKLLLDMLQQISGKSGETMLDEIHSEILEENLFLVAKGNYLIHTFDSSLWCATARKLVRDVAGKLIAEYKLEDPLVVTDRRLKSLATHLLELAANAVSNIREACNKLRLSNTILCYFDSAVQSLYFDEIRDEQDQEKIFYAYQDALELGCMEDCVDIEDPEFPWNISSKFLRTLNSKVCDDNDVVNCGIFSEILSDLHSLQSGASRVDENWYALWQVVRVVHCFATKCIKWNIGGKGTGVPIYSLERLCKRVGINIQDARKMLSQEMVQKPKPHIIKRKPSKYSPTARIDYTATNCHRSGLQFDDSDGSLPEGWRLERIQRPCSRSVDKYWFTKTGKKLRSRNEVEIFLKSLELSNSNENDAHELFIAEVARLRRERSRR